MNKYILDENIDVIKSTIDDIDLLSKFQNKVISEMPDKSFFSPLVYQEFADAIKIGKVYMLSYNNSIIGLVVLNCGPKKDIIDEYSLDDVSGVGILDSIMIDREYRGSGLQRQIINYIEKDISDYGLKRIVATVHPSNIWSLNNFLDCDYEIINKINIHGGERLILAKDFKNNGV